MSVWPSRPGGTRPPWRGQPAGLPLVPGCLVSPRSHPVLTGKMEVMLLFYHFTWSHSFLCACIRCFLGVSEGSRAVLRWYRYPDDRLSWGHTLLAPGGGAQAVGKWDPVVCGSRWQGTGHRGCELVCPDGARGTHDGDEREGFLRSCVLKQK